MEREKDQLFLFPDEWKSDSKETETEKGIEEVGGRLDVFAVVMLGGFEIRHFGAGGHGGLYAAAMDLV